MDKMLLLGLGGHVLYGAMLLVFLKLTRQTYLSMQQRKSGYGVVYDSRTGQPLPLVTVRLRDYHGLAVRTTATDVNGQYRLMAPKGEYQFEVTKTGYSFPSKVTGKKALFNFYEHPLLSSRVRISDFGAITKNIPLDPASSGGSHVLGRKLSLTIRTQAVLGLAGPVIMALVAYLWNRPFVWLMLIAYIAVLIIRIVTFKRPQPPYGIIRDAQTGKPIERAIVRLFGRDYNKLLETEVTTGSGRYAFLVKKGDYHIIIKKDGYRSVRLNFPRIIQDKFLLAKNVKLAKVAGPVDGNLMD